MNLYQSSCTSRLLIPRLEPRLRKPRSRLNFNYNSVGMASWQVDIPGLSQLIIGAGAHGLKQLALSGVDIHTIGCMLMVGELTPASQNFRNTLNNQREKQRNERQWLYSLVEIGAASSFLVDHLLKTRAGENVLALLASMIPLMSPDASSATLSILFETAHVPNDHTPGVNQFHKLRAALVTFARRIGFQERVLQYHSLIERIVSSNPARAIDLQQLCPFEAIPSKQSLPRIIQLCHKLSTHGNRAVLVYRGFQGAGWVAAYAGFILGLSVCAVDQTGVQIPISDCYSEAKVILEIAAIEHRCEIHVEGTLSDFILTNSLDDASRRSWSINCAELNFLGHNLPELTDPDQISTVSRLVAVETLNEVAHRAFKFSTVSPSPGFQPYFVSVIPYIQDRALDILSCLGFDPKVRSNYRFNSAFICEDALERPDHRQLPPHFLGRVNEVIERAILFASQLAYTNWNTSVQTMSARHFHGRAYGRELLQRSHSGEIQEPVLFSRVLLACIDTVDEVTLRQKLCTYDWLGLSLDGMVVLRTLLTRHSISQIRGEIYTFLPGQISFEGQPRNIIRMDFESDVGSKPIGSLQENSVQPMDIASALRSRFLFSSTGDTLWVRHEILNGSELFTVANPVYISVSIRNMFVAQPCKHAYDTAFTPEIVHQSDMWKFSSGFDLYDPYRRTQGSRNFYYQLVDKNDMGQWLACQWGRERMVSNSVLILQDNTCLECIMQRIIDGSKFRHGFKEIWRVCIIAGSSDDRE